MKIFMFNDKGKCKRNVEFVGGGGGHLVHMKPILKSSLYPQCSSLRRK